MQLLVSHHGRVPRGSRPCALEVQRPGFCRAAGTSRRLRSAGPARARTSDRGAATPRPHHVACSMGFDPAPVVRGRAPEARGGGLQLRHWAALEPQEWPPGGRTTGRSSRHVECSRPRSAPGGRAACPDAWAGCRVEIAASRDLAMTGRGGGPTQEGCSGSKATASGCTCSCDAAKALSGPLERRPISGVETATDIMKHYEAAIANRPTYPRRCASPTR